MRGFSCSQALFWVGVLSGEDVRRAPPGHVASLFDCYADSFDSHLVKALQYRTPALLMDAIVAAADQVRLPPGTTHRQRRRANHAVTSVIVLLLSGECDHGAALVTTCPPASLHAACSGGIPT